MLTVPAGYGTGGAGRNPIGVTFIGKANSEAALLAAGYAFEQATNVRLAPCCTNPSMFRCVPGSTFFSPHHCHPGDLQSARPRSARPRRPVAGDVGGTVPATLSLALGTPAATFGAFTPGVTKDYTASTTANVISTAGDAALTVSDPPGPAADQRHVLAAVAAGGGVLEDAGRRRSPTTSVTITFKQHIGATDALRTGAYSKTLTFTLCTTTP